MYHSIEDIETVVKQVERSFDGFTMTSDMIQECFDYLIDHDVESTLQMFVVEYDLNHDPSLDIPTIAELNR